MAGVFLRSTAIIALLAMVPATCDAQANDAPDNENSLEAEAVAEVFMTVPVREGRVFRGEVDVRVGIDGSNLAVDAQQLVRLFEGRITPGAETSLITAANGDGYVTREEAEQAALELEFDLSAVEVRAQFAGSARSLTTLSLDGRRDRERVRNGREPEGISAFLNIESFVTGDDFDGSYSINRPNFNFDSAIHIAPLAHLTIEGTASVSANGDFRRGGIRGVWFDDQGDWSLRVGDVGLSGLSFMNSTSILGAEYTNRTQFSATGSTIRSIGDNSFELERSAIARLIVNGVEVRTFNLDPGPYNVQDFPLTDGANDVVFVIEDDTGEIERIEFNTFADVSLLAPGQYEYGLSAGVTSDGSESGFDYDGDPAISGFVETGLTNNLSLGVGAQATDDAQLVASIARLGTTLGRFDAQLGASTSERDGEGLAAQLGWRKSFDIEDSLLDPSFGLSATYRSEKFGGLFTDTVVDNETEWQFSASYAQPLPRQSVLSVGLNYSINRASNDNLSASLTFGRSFGAWGLSAGLNYQSAPDTGEEDLEGFFRLTYQFDSYSSSFVDYETNDNRISAGYSQRSERGGVGAWSYTLGASRSDSSDVNLTGGAGYTGNRFEVTASQSANVEALGGGAQGGARTSVRVGTALAYADGKVAIGRPVRGGFAIFDTHPNLEDRPVLVGISGSSGDYVASSGPLGPALAPNVGGGFGDRVISYDVDDLPLGYDLGQGAAELSPRYRSGFGVEVGSAYTVTAIGNLLDAFGDPLSLKIGTATALDDADAPEVEIFTNRNGRFGALGLAPGRWQLVMQTQPALTYVLTVPEDAVGLFRTGELLPGQN